jgi:RHS repeat-associated protein
MLTNTSGTVEGTMTYDAYGNETGHTGSATTPLGYDRQYTSTDTGLIYLRARTYDPSTAQFATQDPLEALTGEPYGYAGDDPVNYGDPTGLCNANPLSSSFWTHGNCISEASNAAGITPIVTSPAVIDAGAVAICALPFTDVACPAAIAVAFGSSTLGVAGQGICTNWSNPAKLAAEEAVNGVLGAAGAGGVKMAKLAEGAPAYAKAIIQGGPAALLGGLDAARAGGSECGCS